jgi:hypothetical protein
VGLDVSNLLHLYDISETGEFAVHQLWHHCTKNTCSTKYTKYTLTAQAILGILALKQSRQHAAQPLPPGYPCSLLPLTIPFAAFHLASHTLFVIIPIVHHPPSACCHVYFHVHQGSWPIMVGPGSSLWFTTHNRISSSSLCCECMLVWKMNKKLTYPSL